MSDAAPNRTASARVGFSSNADTDAALEEALSAALASGDAPPQLVIVYATIMHDQARILRAIQERLPGVPVAGASSAGVSVNGKATEAPRCLALTVVRSHAVRARVACVEDVAADAARAGRALAEKLGAASTGPSTVFVWYDPLTGVNVSALLAGLSEGGYPAVFGGGAGQPLGPRIKTFQYCGDRLLSGSAVALAIDGLSVVYEMTHGTEPTGLELEVTRARDNVIEELDGQPALDVCREQLGLEEIQVQSPDWALGFKPPEGTAYEGLFTRGIFGTDPDKKTITLQAPVVEGTRVQICIRTREAVMERALVMARRLRAALEGKQPVLAVSFECAARPPFVGAKLANQEVVDVQSLIGPTIPWIGMLAWGEIAPLSGRSEFHNYTFPLCVLCD
jgi:hypothetical protein